MSQYLIGTFTVGATPTTISLTSIPAIYTDLLVTFSLRTNNNAFLGVYFNGSTSGYTSRTLMGNGSSASSFSRTDYYANDTNHPGLTANTFGNGTLYVPNYAGSTNKAYSMDHVQEANQSDAKQTLLAGLWSNTAAITSITFDNYTGGTFVQGSTVSVYGIKNLPASLAKASGGAITYDANYVYHTFTGSANFVTTTAIPEMQVLTVAGGGGGGNTTAAGGGAGGYLASTLSNVASGTLLVATIGAGGAGGSTRLINGANGTNTSFSTATAIGGGGAKSWDSTTVAGSGGSGGGSSNTNLGNAAGAGVAGQGYAGGNGAVFGGGGGGGANAAGGDGTATVAGNGGAGKQWLDGSYYAGGGGGGNYGNTAGSGGIGGGGAGKNSGVTGDSGTPNTGGGGGAGGYPGDGAGGNGGSGIVIIRYAR